MDEHHPKSAVLRKLSYALPNLVLVTYESYRGFLDKTPDKLGSGSRFEAENSVTFGTEQRAKWNIHLLRTPPSSPTSFDSAAIGQFRTPIPKLFEGL